MTYSFRPLRHVGGLCLAALAAFSATYASAQAQDLPKNIRLVVPFSPGGSNDVFARALAQRMASRNGITVVVENKPGAGGAIGAQAVATATPDGTTLLLNSVSFSTNAAVQAKLPYDPIKAFEPVAMLNRGPMLLVTPANAPYANVGDVLKAIRGPKKDVNFGSAGQGSTGHLAGELLNAMATGNAVHVPYKGISNAATDMIGGNLQIMVTTAASIAGPLKGGQIRAIAVTSAQRSKFTPELPTVGDVLPGFDVESWWGIFAPAKTSRAMVDRLNQEIRAIADTPEMRELFSRESTEPSAMTSQQFAAYVQSEINKWRKLVKDRNIAMATE
ncbi:MAG: tripartite tricarboxylate transporter substrate-binding protein [Ramlibacter sp.]|uniref:tripartite tricarboxylate transporter substrate-binding protein n=1 Tax=Ramlibacter sp. TaxID=1917967 RepID=UPI00262B90BD|nr:tripartite tricarboxylate transporter substrate-binding protein [Ramlibacter sp.]MDH4375507.1 tripartite tricarboxylate transporter substrate-binding protein [Ramlibacter sp.]